MFKTRIKELRNKHNLTMSELGDKLGVGKSAIAGYESGQRNPKIETLHKLSSIFNVSADYLLGLTDNPTPVEESTNLAKLIENNSFHYNGEKLSEADLHLLIGLLERFSTNAQNNDVDCVNHKK